MVINVEFKKLQSSKSKGTKEEFRSGGRENERRNVRRISMERGQ